MRISAMVGIGLIPILAAGLVPEAEAQQYFGKNRVQYAAHDWRTLRTEHCDVYYYVGEREAALDVARMAERAYARLAARLDHDMGMRIPIILYASHADFQATNILPEILEEGNGGMAEYRKQRVFLPFTGSTGETERTLVLELGRAFLTDILYRDSQSVLRRLIGYRPPAWVMEGSSAHLARDGRDPRTAMWLRDAALQGYLLPLSRLDEVYDARSLRFGQSLFDFLERRYGRGAVPRLWRQLARTHSLERSVEEVTGTDLESISRAWLEDVRRTAVPQTTGRREPSQIARAITDHEHDASTMNLVPALSPDGERVVYIADRDLTNGLYLASARDGNVHGRLAETAPFGDVEAQRFFSASLDWSPDGTRIAYPAPAGGRDAIVILDVESRKQAGRIEPPVSGIGSVAWSPDGGRFVFSGFDGGHSDLYVVDADGSGFRRLTRDGYAALEPRFSPDGRTVVFVTDRGPGTDLDALVFGPPRLAFFHLDTGTIEVPPGQSGGNVSPHFTPDGRGVLFISDRSGTGNLHRLDLDTGRTTQLTDVVTGIGGPTPGSSSLSLSRDGRRLAFSAFGRGGWDIYVMKAPLALPPVDPSAAPEALAELSVPPGDTASLPDTASFTDGGYRSRFSVDYGAAGAGFGGNVGVMGQTMVGLSDMLGDRTIMVGAHFYGTLEEPDLFLQYADQGRRINWAVAGYQFRNDYLLSTRKDAEGFKSNLYRGVEVVLSRPSDRVSRFELGLEGVILSRRVFEQQHAQPVDPARRGEGIVVYFAPSLSWVRDTSIPGPFGAVSGSRMRLEAAQGMGEVEFAELKADLRRYVDLGGRCVMAGRVLAAASFGEDPRIYRVGGPYTFRAVDYGELEGSRLGMTNLEFRFPLIDRLELGWPARVGVRGVRGALFLDTGAAWGDAWIGEGLGPEERASRRAFTPFSDRGGFRLDDLQAAYGLGVRMNLWFLWIRWDLAQATDLRRNIGSTRGYFALGGDF